MRPRGGAGTAEEALTKGGRPGRQLGFFDAVCMMIGIVIGVGIYESPPRVAANVSDPTALLLAWALGGVLAFIGVARTGGQGRN